MSIFRLLEEDIDNDGDIDQVRVVLSCPDNGMLLQPLDHIIALVQVPWPPSHIGHLSPVRGRG